MGNILRRIISRNGVLFAKDKSTVSPILKTTVTLTDAQIKALPTTPVEIIAAPGPGKYINFIQAVIYLKASVGYGNAAGATMYLEFEYDNNVSASQAITNKDNTVLVYFFAAAAGASVEFFGQYVYARTDRSIAPSQNDGSDVVNLPLTLYFGVPAGALTGGNVGNTMKVTVYYTIEDV